MESGAVWRNTVYFLKNRRGELHSPLGNLARLSIWNHKVKGIAVRRDAASGSLGECDEGRDEDDTVNWESKKAGTYQRTRIFGEKTFISNRWKIKAAEYPWRPN
jgi:hypothetical protein